MKKYVVANWKMSLGILQSRDLAIEFAECFTKNGSSHEIIICPSYPALPLVGNRLLGTSLQLGAQDCSPHANGAYTGDVSADMLMELRCSYVIIGHSERRQHHHETSELIADKVSILQRHAITPIMCIGETLQEREAGTALKILEMQLKSSLPRNCNFDQLIVAYEPIWAIGTGVIPTTREIAEVHQYLKKTIESLSGQSTTVPILYGGSVKPDNAKEILSIDSVDGVLVGGASTNTKSLLQIVSSIN